MLNKAVFLDSDGVLNTAVIKDGKPVAPTSVNDLEIPEEVRPALEHLKAAGYILICVTNKPDIERGRMTQADVDAIYAKMRRELPLDEVLICYKENSPCYKPNPGMLLEGQHKYALELSQSYIIGDRWKDIAAGKNAGCKTIWINRGYKEMQPDPPADYTALSLAEAVQWIVPSTSTNPV